MQLPKLSISPVNTFKSCPKKFYYEYVLGYDKAVKAPWLKIGSAYDDALGELDKYEDWYIGKAAAVGKASATLEGNELIDFTFILEYYYKPFWEKNRFAPVAGGNQVGFGIPAYEGADWQLTGYLDKLSEQVIDGQPCHVVVERKTTTDPIEENSAYWNKLDLDPQIRSYVWYCKQMGYKAGWVSYEVIRKINSTLVSGLDRTLQGEDYWNHLVAWYAKLGHKKTLVANKMFYVTEEMLTEFVEEQTMTRGMILETHKTSQVMKEAGFSPESAWVKHEQSCKEYGGCPFLPVCKKDIDLSNPVFARTHKVLK